MQEVKQTKTITETMRVVDDDGNIIKTGDPETDAVGYQLLSTAVALVFCTRDGESQVHDPFSAFCSKQGIR